MEALMSATTIVTLELPTHTLSDPRYPLQRSLIRHLLYEERLTMLEALERLSMIDQRWLVETILLDVQKNISLLAHLTDSAAKAQYWQQSHVLLGHLLQWREHWTPYHGQLLAMLRLVLRRYSPDLLTAKQFKLLLTLVRRLGDEHLYREDIFSATKALKAEGLDAHLNLLSGDNTLFHSYLEELGRA
jgi:hypothetical protein